MSSEMHTLSDKQMPILLVENYFISRKQVPFDATVLNATSATFNVLGSSDKHLLLGYIKYILELEIILHVFITL